MSTGFAQRGGFRTPSGLWPGGAGLPVIGDRKKMATGSGIMPTGRRNWVRSDEGRIFVVVVSWINAFGV